MRQKIVAGNWKMNNDKNQTQVLINGIKEEIKDLALENTRVIISPSFINLESAVNNTEDSKIEVVAQNMHQAKSGAYTGEVSADMLKSISIKSVILGHSERRTYFGETDELLAEKVNTVLENDLETIFCFGELLEDRKSDNHFNVVESQLKNALFHLEAKDWASIVLAYEPVWAIGTGETASPEQAQEMHAFIRSIVEKQYNKEVAENVSILYGGSVKPANAVEIFSKPDVDGGLIGGAALKSSDFSAIIKAI
ncbi:triose-phosphate isomerase [Polaribacter vadi]|uniref:triose-phosphate isomerase n=1 Tax=Polaribacter TaxID=52959 RepID=UPI001C0807DF|nr:MULTISPECIES: triose-phosphate isomerase [Polaribacter]MBU3010442.1 triose-phosphate isomerase [Polaribacter vadi]MDO6740250.1 triose-phosphate isomerase [Polaribacter sp. 1_MG-2023]